MEAVVIIDRTLLAFLKLHAPLHQPGESFLGLSAVSFRTIFSRLVKAAKLPKLNWQTHSLRRGGATAFFRRTGDLSRTIERGRWATSRVARLYIQDGLATQVENRPSSCQWRQLQREGVQVQRFMASI